jgi:uncharacterized protein YjbJ (UPF0337 family)
MSSGKMEEVKGRVKRAAGELTENQRRKDEGTIDKTAGRIKQGVDKVKNVLKGKR